MFLHCVTHSSYKRFSESIASYFSLKMNLTRGINLRKIAEMMPGASGAEVKVGSTTNTYSC